MDFYSNKVLSEILSTSNSKQMNPLSLGFGFLPGLGSVGLGYCGHHESLAHNESFGIILTTEIMDFFHIGGGVLFL